jgi:hypothetical protein
MGLDLIDRVIAREVGELCWHLLPSIQANLGMFSQADLEKVRRAPAYQPIWAPAEDDELRRVREEDPFVSYPVLLLDSDRQLDSLAGLIYPPRHGVQLRLSGYLRHLRRFLILQLTAGHEAAARRVMRAVREFAKTASRKELLEFVDLIWRGRWIVGSFEWGRLRLSVLAGGADGLAALLADYDRLETEAVTVMQTERQLKDSAASMEEWLHEIFCLLPAVHATLFALGKANEARYSDELEKFDRVLDEFQADIHTTLLIAFEERRILETYIIKPLHESPDVDAALKQIRGLYRGRTIIPRAWHQFVERTAKGGGGGPPSPAARASELLNVISLGLSQPDPCAAFGRATCMDRDSWVLLNLEID